jgi:endonuclease/exonuclease/phosphatase family metal-dependent hydrolase
MTAWRRTLLGALYAIALCGSDAQAASLRVTTWNLEWFPNGSKDELTPAEVETRIKAAADVLRPLNPDIILLQEVRDEDACNRLAEAIYPHTYSLAVCSRFKEPFHPGIGRQQVAILGKESAQAAWSEQWKSRAGVDPPRGFAFAWYKFHGSDVGLFAVHLKSNLIMRGDKEEETAKNIRKREVAAEQIVEYTAQELPKRMPAIGALIVGGDFNTNLDQPEFAVEKTIPTLTAAGFRNCMEALAATQRVTHPGSGHYPDATFDYLLGKNANPGPPRIVRTNASDHLPVTVDFTLTGNPSQQAAAVSAKPAAKPQSTAATTIQIATILQPVRVKIPYGETVIPKGTKLPVVSRDGQTVRVDYLGEVQTVPVEATDLR